jgi:hypothetical protein
MSLNTTLCEGNMFGYFFHSVKRISSGQAQSEPIKRHPLYSQTWVKGSPLGLKKWLLLKSYRFSEVGLV